MSRLSKVSKQYWDSNPIGVEPFKEAVGSPEFYREYIAYYDRFYSYKKRVFQYEKYRGRRVLEIGCGLGIDSYKFAKDEADLTCVDFSDTAVRNTRRLLRQLGLKATVLQADAQNLAFQDESFDVVYAYGILMHVENEQKGWDEIYRVLKPGGVALITVYHRRSWFWLLKKLSATVVESEAGDPPINRVHSLGEIRDLLHRYSSVDIRLERFPERTRRRTGGKAFLYNWVFVPVTKAAPRPLIRPFGWHIVAKAVK